VLHIDKRILNFLIIIILSFITFAWTYFIFHEPFDIMVVMAVIAVRMLASRFILSDYSLSWSNASQKTFLLKGLVYFTAFIVYMPFFYTHVRFSFLLSELSFYILSINFMMYVYYYIRNKSHTKKVKRVVIYGAGKAGMKLESEFLNSEYKVKYFVDDDKLMQKRSVDSVNILSKNALTQRIGQDKYDLLAIAMPSTSKDKIKEIYDQLGNSFLEIQVLPRLEDIAQDKDFSAQLKNITVEDLLARNPKDLDKNLIKTFIKDKTILITGAGGSIGSELCKQCEKYQAKKLILLDHSEYNLYAIAEEMKSVDTSLVMQSVTALELLDETFKTYKPDIVIHAAAYKHVPLVEANIYEGIYNNVIGTKNIVDTSIKYAVEKVVMISTDKAVRPTNVMGTTKRICELYAQNAKSSKTEIVAVRFGNVLGSSGSVIPKFKRQIAQGQNVTVTHPEITRYFMLIPEACELVLQAASLGTGGEIFILDMGEPIKIVDLAQKMIALCGRENVKIEFCGLRPGEKLYEELLIDDSDDKTDYESITVAKPTFYDIDKLNEDIKELLVSGNRLKKLKEIVPEFNHRLNL
jgi:FlaA1/EpsC-like NDP-sugar epimerase